MAKNKQHRWTAAEERIFFKAVKKYGWGKWKEIHESGVLSHLTRSQIKSKGDQMKDMGVGKFMNYLVQKHDAVHFLDKEEPRGNNVISPPTLPSPPHVTANNNSTTAMSDATFTFHDFDTNEGQGTLSLSASPFELTSNHLARVTPTFNETPAQDGAFDDALSPSFYNTKPEDSFTSMF